MTAIAPPAPLAVITGASSGIGRELARQFAEHGFDVVVAAEDEELATAAADLRSATAAQVNEVQVDLAEYDGVERLYQAIRSDGRPVAALALNAGIGLGGNFAADQSLDDALRLVRLNVESTVHLAKRVLPDMTARGEGKVLFTSSIASESPGPYQALYNASKSFVQSFAEALADELGDSGVTVTALMPGPTDTEFFERAGLQDTKLGAGRKDDPALVARQGFEALMDGKPKVQGGSFSSKVQGKAMKVLPDKAKAAFHRHETEPGSAKS
ncbi:MAG TPA: SDR family NAD(P)-dependent oxidoreductase [Acidimicrobiales bacterium]|jgi:short-subunit dehydrogenase